ncbi:HesA/MoeB/ThiF family protein [Candidatus Bipolaricaulota sp. J31]
MADGRFARQEILPELGPEGQRRLGEARVLVVGCGALGSHTAAALLRAGVRRLILVDRDIFELHNLHRVALYTESDVGRPKAEALAERLRAIDGAAEIEEHVAHFGPHEAEELVPGVDLVVDGLDNMETRYLLNDACLKHGVPWIYTAVLGTAGMMMPIVPGAGPCLRCLFPSPPPPGALPTCATHGILGPVPRALGALQAVLAIRLLVGEEISVGRLFQFELWGMEFRELSVPRREDCPACARGEYEFLRESSRTATLCGDAIHILPRSREALDLEELARRLAGLGRVRRGDGVLFFDVDEVSFTVFSDGRAIIKGVKDPARAQALYDQYISR